MKRLAVVAALAVLCGVVLLCVFSQRLLWDLSAAMVDNEPPEKADMVVVLGGDPRGRRLSKAMQLIQQGYAPKLMISAPMIIYGVRESTLAADYAARHGMPPDKVIALVSDDLSTTDEARDIVPELRKLGVHRYLLVTSPSHTGRAARVFRRAAPDLTVRPVASADPAWCRGYWWTGRECRKTWLLEAAKDVGDFFRF